MSCFFLIDTIRLADRYNEKLGVLRIEKNKPSVMVQFQVLGWQR
jgi:hypothetical protein